METKSFFQFYSAKAGHAIQHFCAEENINSVYESIKIEYPDAVIKMKGYEHDKTGKIVKVGA